MVVVLEVPESSDDSGAVADGFTAAAALPTDLAVFEPDDDVFGPSSDASMIAVVVVMDDDPVRSRRRVMIDARPR